MSANFSLLAKRALEEEAKRLSVFLVARYKQERAALPHLDSICIDMIDNYPEDAVIERATAILHNLWRIEPRQFQATSGRAGCIWVTPKFPYS